ncbi:MAG: hypothetical protein ACYDDV_02895 [Methanoregula sp.]
MRTGIPVIIILAVILLAAGCIRVPGMHILQNAPDPVVGQWVSGEPPASELNMVFFENRTWISRSFYLGPGEKLDHGTWTRGENGMIFLESANGNATSWINDPTDDSIHMTGLPQKKYYRFKG